MVETKAWNAFEDIGISIVNPRSVFKFTKPDSMSSEEFERIVKLIEESLDDDDSNLSEQD
jgi:hypothetical protein